MRRWDMAGSPCGLPKKMLHRVKSHRNFKPYPAAATPCASASLLAQQKFDYAQDDRLTFYLVIIFAFDNLIFNKTLEK